MNDYLISPQSIIRWIVVTAIISLIFNLLLTKTEATEPVYKPYSHFKIHYPHIQKGELMDIGYWTPGKLTAMKLLNEVFVEYSKSHPRYKPNSWDCNNISRWFISNLKFKVAMSNDFKYNIGAFTISLENYPEAGKYHTMISIITTEGVLCYEPQTNDVIENCKVEGKILFNNNLYK